MLRIINFEKLIYNVLHKFIKYKIIILNFDNFLVIFSIYFVILLFILILKKNNFDLSKLFFYWKFMKYYILLSFIFIFKIKEITYKTNDIVADTPNVIYNHVGTYLSTV